MQRMHGIGWAGADMAPTNSHAIAGMGLLPPQAKPQSAPSMEQVRMYLSRPCILLLILQLAPSFCSRERMISLKFEGEMVTMINNPSFSTPWNMGISLVNKPASLSFFLDVGRSAIHIWENTSHTK